MINVLVDLDPVLISFIVIICIIVGLLIFGIIYWFLLRGRKRNLDAIKESKKIKISDDEFLNVLGGKENIISYKLIGSRLSLVLKDYSKVDKEVLKKENFDGIIEMKNKIILVKEDLSKELKALENFKSE